MRTHLPRITEPSAHRHSGQSLRHLRCADPAQPQLSCEVWISPQHVTLRRNIAGMIMYCSIDLALYSCLAARELSNGTYALDLVASRADFNLRLADYQNFYQLSAALSDWAGYTRLPIKVETQDGTLIALPSPGWLARRKGRASALKYRRRGQAWRRRPGNEDLQAIRYRHEREITSYE